MAYGGADVGFYRSVEELEYNVRRVIAAGQPVSLDIETGYEGPDRAHKNSSPSVHPEENMLVGVSFTNDPAWARYAPVAHDESRYNLDPYSCAQLMWDLASTGLCVPHNMDFEERVMSRWFRALLAPDNGGGLYADRLAHEPRTAAVRASNGYFPVRSDTQAELHALGSFQSVALKAASKVVLGYDQPELTSLFPGLPKNKEHTIRFNPLDPSDPKVYGYACDDVICTLLLHQRHFPLVQDAGTPGPGLIYAIEMGVIPIVIGMEDEGLCYDWPFLAAAASRGQGFSMQQQTHIQQMLAKRLGTMKAINLSSPKQLQQVLYGPPEEGGLGLRTHLRTKGGKNSAPQMSTSKLALKPLAAREPIVASILEWKALKKLLSAYLETYEREYGYALDGRVHAHLIPHGTITGRFASADPNYQQSPKKYHLVITVDGVVVAEFSLNFRDAIVAPPGWYGMGFDFSQIELRVIAGEAQEPALLEAFARGDDPHVTTAALLLGITAEEVLEGGHRPTGKTLNFALVYQLAIKGLADRLGIPEDDARDLYERYFMIYSRIGRYTRNVILGAHRDGCTRSAFGRKHVIWEYASDKPHIVAKGDRTAGNAPIQGGAADYVKLTMIRVHNALKAAGMLDRVRLVMNVHDALEFYVRKDVRPQEVIDVLGPVICAPVPFAPHWPAMAVEWHVWERWGSAVELHLDARGQITGAGDVKDIGMQEDEEDDEGGYERVREDYAAAQGAVTAAAAMPAANGYPVQQAPLAEAAPPVMVVTCPQMPELAALRRFTALLADSPGPNAVQFVTPEGTTDLAKGTSLTPDSASSISIALGGATVTWAAGTVPGGRLSAGLSL